MKLAACLSLVFLLAAVPAAAQSIPVDIPDHPDESPSDREREKREERFRPFLSRAYLTTSVGAAPLLHRSGTVFDTFVQAGFQLDDEVSIFLMGGPRIVPQVLDDQTGRMRSEGGYIGSVGIEIRDRSHMYLENWTLSLAAGTWTSDVDIYFAEISPRYIHRLNSYWQLAAGVKANVASYSEGGVFFFAGPSIGIRRHFGQRTVLE